MSVDTVSNMISTIKNASLIGKEYVEVIYSNQSKDLAETLKDTGFVAGVKVFKEKDTSFKKIRIDLAYKNGRPAITEIKRISKPGNRIYSSASDLGRFMSGYGIRIVSTSRGVMHDVEAKKKKLGGEVICKVY